MTIPSQDSLNEISAYLAMRDSAADSKNAEQLETWKRKLFRDPVSVPEAKEPPKWPAQRASLGTVIRLPARKKA